MRSKTSILTILALCLVVAFLASPVWAAKEKGAKKCSDGIDNDDDGLIDGDDPDCGGDDGEGPPASTGNFRITINWDDAEVVSDFLGMTVDCREQWCDLIAEDLVGEARFDFSIPPSYYNEWSGYYDGSPLTGAEECFGGPLDGVDDDALVLGTRIIVRQGPDSGWSLVIGYDASFIGSTRTKSHHLPSAGSCGGAPCDPLPSTPGATVTYDIGTVLRTQVGQGKPPKGSIACTCVGTFPDCPFVEDSVSVTVERLQ